MNSPYRSGWGKVPEMISSHRVWWRFVFWMTALSVVLALLYDGMSRMRLARLPVRTVVQRVEVRVPGPERTVQQCDRCIDTAETFDFDDHRARSCRFGAEMITSQVGNSTILARCRCRP